MWFGMFTLEERDHLPYWTTEDEFNEAIRRLDPNVSLLYRQTLSVRRSGDKTTIVVQPQNWGRRLLWGTTFTYSLLVVPSPRVVGDAADVAYANGPGGGGPG